MILKLLALLGLAIVGCVPDPAVLRLKDASGYLASGYAQSTILENTDWSGQMGAIQSAEVRVYPVGNFGNKAPNPGFETAMDFTLVDDPGVYKIGLSTGYDISISKDGYSKGWTISQATTEHHAGLMSLKIAHEAAGLYTAGLLLHNKVQVCPGENWRMTVWVKGTGGVRLRLFWSGPDFSVGTITQVDVNPCPADWTQYTVNGTIPAGSTGVYYGLHMLEGTTGTCYFDDVSFGRVPAEGAIQVALSRDGGSSFTSAPITFDEAADPGKGTVNSRNTTTAQSALIVEGETRKTPNR